MTEAQIKTPINDSAKDGLDQLVSRGSEIACAFWTGDMWAYGGAAREGVTMQLDFEPTHYEPRKSA